MSTPLANKNKNKIQQMLISMHQKTSHSHRIDLLSGLFAGLIKKYLGEKKLKCLDVGTGDMVIAEHIAKRLPNSSWVCTDLYELSEEFKAQERWQKYIAFNGKDLPFENNQFDVIVFSDVLHHTGENLEPLLNEAQRVGKYILIKDHYEYGWYSRMMLKAMDIFGNWAYKVTIPEHYLSPKKANIIFSNMGLECLEEISSIELYDHLPIIRSVLKSKWQFITLLKCTELEDNV